MVPGQIKGLHEAWQRYGSGNVKWEELLQPTIDLARNGFKVTKAIDAAIKAVQGILEQERFHELRYCVYTSGAFILVIHFTVKIKICF